MIDQIYAAPKGCSLEDGLAFAREHRLAFELPGLSSLDDLEGLQACLEGFTGNLALHGPRADLNVVSPDSDIRRISRLRFEQALHAAKTLGARYVVFRSQWTPLIPATQQTKQWLGEMTDFWELFIEEHVDDSGVTVLLENFLDPTPELLNAILARIASPNLKACLDTGHVNLFSRMSPVEWTSELGHNLVYVHGNNNNGETDEHEAFDKGLIDMEGFLNHLALLPSKVHLAIETQSLNAMQRSLDFCRPYLQLQAEQFATKSFLI